MDVEERLRVCLEQHAARVPGTPVPLAAVRAAINSRRTQQRRARAGAGAALLVAGVAVGTALYRGERSPDSPGPAASLARTAAVVPFTPSVPTGASTCGDYAFAVTTRAGTLPLAFCDGWPVEPPTTVTIAVGDQITISPENAVLSASPDDLLEPHGGTFIGVRPGVVTLTVHNADCAVLPPAHQQPTACALLKIRVLQ